MPGRDQLGLWDRGRRPIPVTRDTAAMARRRARETGARDDVLARLRETRERLITEGKAIAHRIAVERGRVTSVEVLATMRSDPTYAEDLAKCDPRWVGCLFRAPFWMPVGTEREGSHRRPVTIWELRDEHKDDDGPDEPEFVPSGGDLSEEGGLLADLGDEDGDGDG